MKSTTLLSAVVDARSGPHQSTPRCQLRRVAQECVDGSRIAIAAAVRGEGSGVVTIRRTPSDSMADGAAWLQRVRGEFLEMPGLCLSVEQAQRLWGLERHTCEGLLNTLTDAQFLDRTATGVFVMRTPRV